MVEMNKNFIYLGIAAFFIAVFAIMKLLKNKRPQQTPEDENPIQEQMCGTTSCKYVQCDSVDKSQCASYEAHDACTKTCGEKCLDTKNEQVMASIPEETKAYITSNYKQYVCSLDGKPVKQNAANVYDILTYICLALSLSFLAIFIAVTIVHYKTQKKMDKHQHKDNLLVAVKA